MAEVHDMYSRVKMVPVLSLLLAGGVAFTAAYRLSAQQSTSGQAAGESRSYRPGIAPGLKVTDLGRSSSRTYRINMVKGDEIISGLLLSRIKYSRVPTFTVPVGRIRFCRFSAFWQAMETVTRVADECFKALASDSRTARKS